MSVRMAPFIQLPHVSRRSCNRLLWVVVCIAVLLLTAQGCTPRTSAHSLVVHDSHGEPVHRAQVAVCFWQTRSHTIEPFHLMTNRNGHARMKPHRNQPRTIAISHDEHGSFAIAYSQLRDMPRIEIILGTAGELPAIMDISNASATQPLSVSAWALPADGIGTRSVLLQTPHEPSLMEAAIVEKRTERQLVRTRTLHRLGQIRAQREQPAESRDVWKAADAAAEIAALEEALDEVGTAAVGGVARQGDEDHVAYEVMDIEPLPAETLQSAAVATE